jgi:pseudaminic acid biosynthesis-associated methylase
MSKRTPQVDLWRSEFGDAYTERNVYEYQIRLPAWRAMVEGLKLSRVLEVGCNYGSNLLALADINPAWDMTGIEPNDHARKMAPQGQPHIHVLPGTVFDMDFEDGSFDLSFTANVLIHIALADLPSAIQRIYRTSRHYLLAIEYFAEQETEISYRGRTNALWKRNFKKHIEELYPSLRLLRSGYWDELVGFDASTWWLWEK